MDSFPAPDPAQPAGRHRLAVEEGKAVLMVLHETVWADLVKRIRDYPLWDAAWL
ncbi:MAG: hypothetical protein ACYCTW_09780 [Sulfuricella sp.]